MTSISDALDKAFAVQARGCVALGSPFSAVVLDLMRENGLAGGVMARLMAPFAALDFPGHMAAATPLRPLGFVHDMVLSGEAADWVEANIRPTPGVVTVLYHSVMWSYLPTDIQARIAAHMEAAGREATPQAPVAWLTMEPAQPVQLFMELALALWPKGERRRLGLVHPHGAAVRWGASD